MIEGLDRLLKRIETSSAEELDALIERAQKHNPSQYAKLERMIMGEEITIDEGSVKLGTTFQDQILDLNAKLDKSIILIDELRDKFLELVNALSNAELYQFMHEFDEKYLPFKEEVTKDA